MSIPHNKYILPDWFIKGFFILGLLSGTAIRSLIVFNHVEPALVRLVWYMGVIGYFFFFGFRYFIARRRKLIIREHDLIGKVERREKLSEMDKDYLEYVLISIQKSREMFNYLFIFVTSLIAILTDIILAGMDL